MRFKFSSLCLITILAVFVGFALKANADSSSGILVDIVPPNPAPFENTTITLKSYENNLDSVLISWSVNGKTIASGVGDKSFSTTAPTLGAETNVVATISLPDGPIQTNITIRPSVMVLLWQANDSYVPPFYRGKALPTPDSEVKVVAMPEIRNGSSYVSPQNMTYAWKKDYTNNVDGSGYGKNFFVFVNDYLEDSNNISVTASTVDQKYSSDANIDIRTAQPKILFYRNDTNLGTIWEHSLTDPHKMQGGSDMIVAAPYFISPEEILTPSLVWSWLINDNSVNLTNYKKYLMPLQVKEGTHGTSKLRLDITSKDKIFETASKEINIEF
ncbi:MAG: hypothetical protein NTZ87_03680 [Candidatus Nomurabacteria bacterium]|nr:hypothetical protein [Candidatus Nomurabacteria bacterium]